MTKDNPVAARVAEPLNGLDRLRLYAHDPDTFSFDWDDAVHAVELIDAGCSTASPVQAGIDPLVAEIVGKIEAAFDEWIDVTGAISRHNGWYHECKSFIQDVADEFSPLLRSQAERIATLLAANDPSEREAQAIMDEAAAIERLDAAINDYNTERNLRIAAESLLAEAREALEKIGKTGTAAENYSGDRLSPEEVYMGAVDEMRSIARASLSRLKPGEKGGGE